MLKSTIIHKDSLSANPIEPNRPNTNLVEPKSNRLQKHQTDGSGFTTTSLKKIISSEFTLKRNNHKKAQHISNNNKIRKLMQGKRKEWSLPLTTTRVNKSGKQVGEVPPHLVLTLPSCLLHTTPEL